MASSHPNPASPSDPSASRAGGLAELTARGRALATTAPTPSAIRVVAVHDDEVTETVGDAALAALPELLQGPASAVWVDLTSPTQEMALKVGAALSLHPLIVEDVLEGNQRAKIETTDGVDPHRAVQPDLHGSGRRVGARLRAG